MSLFVKLKDNGYLILENVVNYTLHSNINIYTITFNNGRKSMINVDTVVYIGFCEDLWYDGKGE